MYIFTCLTLQIEYINNLASDFENAALFFGARGVSDLVNQWKTGIHHIYKKIKIVITSSQFSIPSHRRFLFPPTRALTP